MKRIEEALANLTPEGLKSGTKEARIELRVTQAEKEEIRLTAEKLDLSLTEYLLLLHRHAVNRLRDE